MPSDAVPATTVPTDGFGVRRTAREGRITTHTSSLAPGFVLGNLAILPDEIPLFRDCAVTRPAVVAAARPDFTITHSPGAMLVTDLRNSRLTVL